MILLLEMRVRERKRRRKRKRRKKHKHSRLNVVNKKINVDNDIVGCVEEKRKKHQENDCVHYLLCDFIFWLFLPLLLLLLLPLLLLKVVYSSVCFFLAVPVFFSFSNIRRHYNIAKLLLFQLQLPNTDRILTINFLICSFFALSPDWKFGRQYWRLGEHIKTHICTHSHILHATIVLTPNANEPLK